MGKLGYRLAQMMVGRYGFDQFSRDLLAYGMILTVCDMFIPGGIVKLIGTLLIIFAVYRMFSRNHAKMRLQLNWYRTYIDGPLRSYLNRDRKNYTYFKCPTCKQVQRAPKGRGHIRVTCHKCGNVFEKKV